MDDLLKMLSTGDDLADRRSEFCLEEFVGQNETEPSLLIQKRKGLFNEDDINIEIALLG